MRILIVGPAWVGDMVMAQSLFIRLRALHPGARIDVLAPSWTRPILERMPEVSGALDMPLGHGRLGLAVRRRLGHELRRRHYDQAIVLPNSWKSALVPWFADIPLRTGWRGEYRYGLLNDCRRLDRTRLPLMVDRFVALAHGPGEYRPGEYPPPALHVNAENCSALRVRYGLSADRRVLALCPGAEFGPSKQWPVEYFATLARRAVARGESVWILGSANDSDTAGALTEAVGEPAARDCVDFTGKTSLGEAVDLLSMANAVVSNDSGLMHIASALGCPMVVLYGSTSAAFTPPLGDRVRVLSLELDCSPCFQRECPLVHHRCMRDLQPEGVEQALISLIQPASGPYTESHVWPTGDS